MNLSVILPTYNDGPIIADSLKRLLSFVGRYSWLGPFELIVVNDGSTDNTEAKIYELRNRYPQIRYLKMAKNCGKGAAVKRGVLEARGQVVIFTDSDLPYDLGAILNIFETIKSGGADMVIGDRTLPQSRAVRRFPFIRRAYGKIFSLLIRFFLLRGYPDTQCGLKGFRREVARKIFSKAAETRYAIDLELLVVAHALGLKIEKIPVVLYHDNRSRVRLFQDSWDMFKSIFRIRKRLREGVYNS